MLPCATPDVIKRPVRRLVSALRQQPGANLPRSWLGKVRPAQREGRPQHEPAAGQPTATHHVGRAVVRLLEFRVRLRLSVEHEHRAPGFEAVAGSGRYRASLRGCAGRLVDRLGLPFRLGATTVRSREFGRLLFDLIGLEAIRL